ncbi:MAG: hypothetical protein IJY18_04395 [Clostridia bacterium]|nr:hypothetical protein [Clostridia bacterium]
MKGSDAVYFCLDSVNGFPPRLYRDTEEIKRDISYILARSREVKERLNVRELLSEAMTMADEGKAGDVIRLCEEVIEAAAEAERELSSLDSELRELKEELSVVLREET